MRLLALLAALLATVLAAASMAAVASALGTSAPAYTIAFAGAGTEHHVDTQQNIQDSGLCDSAEHVDVTASLAWSTAWPAFRAGSTSLLAQPARIAGSEISGSDVKDACGLPLDQAPQGWVGQSTCHAALVPAGSPSLTVVSKTKTSLVLALGAPPLSVPVGAGCPLNVRNDQLATHVVVPLKKLSALKKHKSLALTVGSARPGPGDLFVESLDCSQATKPYDGYRTTDRCEDDLSWSGTVTFTRAT